MTFWVVILAIAATAQAPAALHFSEVSLRESDPSGGSRPDATFLPSGEFRASRQTLRQLIARAYGLREYQIVDGPDWIGEARFDISAKAPEAASALDGPDLLRRLLAERFGLTTKDERRKIFIRQSPIQTLAGFLESEIGQPIVDRTGLKGKYDADVYSPGVGPGGGRPARREPDDGLFTAVRDQLGLTLEPASVEFRVVKIESARRPMPD